MTIRLQRIYDLALAFQDKYQDDAWEDLFDYLHRASFKKCYSNQDELIKYFSKYIYYYHMYWGTRLTIVKLRNILISGKDTYLEFLCKYNKENFIRAWIRAYGSEHSK